MQPSPTRRSVIERCGGLGLAASLLLSALGIGVAAYLTAVHFREDLLVCNLSGGCETVQKSSYAVVAGVPVAVLGLAMYITLLILTIVRIRRPNDRETLTMVAIAIALAGVAYAGYLTYIELFVIHAICQWCVASAIITLLICINEGAAVWGSFDGGTLEPE
jgi:uncharacterized membrane protein